MNGAFVEGAAGIGSPSPIEPKERNDNAETQATRRKSREEKPKSIAREWLCHRRAWGIGEDRLKLIPWGPV